MLREIIEKLPRKDEILCSGARAIAKKLSQILSKQDFATLKKGGREYTVDSDTVIGGYISAKDQDGKRIELDLCDDGYEVFA